MSQGTREKLQEGGDHSKKNTSSPTRTPVIAVIPPPHADGVWNKPACLIVLPVELQHRGWDIRLVGKQSVQQILPMSSHVPAHTPTFVSSTLGCVCLCLCWGQHRSPTLP